MQSDDLGLVFANLSPEEGDDDVFCEGTESLPRRASQAVKKVTAYFPVDYVI